MNCYLPSSKIIPKSDIVSLHITLTDETKHIINENTLKKKKGSISRSVTVYYLHHNADGTLRKVDLDSRGIWGE